MNSMRLLTAEQISEEWNIPISVIRSAWRTGELRHFIRRGNVRGRLSTADWVNEWINREAKGGNNEELKDNMV